MNLKEFIVQNQGDYDDLMIELEKDGCTWKFGQKPTELNLFEAVPGKDYCILVDAGVVNYKHVDAETFIEDEHTNVEPKKQAKDHEPNLNLSGDLETLRALLNKDEFIGFIKGSLIVSDGKNEEYKQELLKILKMLKAE